MVRAAREARARLFVLVGLSIVSYAVAVGSSWITWLAALVWLVSWPASFGRAKPRPAPRPLLNALALAATGAVAVAALRTPTELVTSVAAYLVVVMLLKLFDRTEPRDLGVLFLASAFLAIGAALTSNALAVGALIGLYAPLAIWTALSLQLRAGAEEALRSAAKVDPAWARRAQCCAADAELDERSDRSLRTLTAASFVCCCGFAVVVFVLAPRNIGAGMLGGFSAPAAGAQTAFDDQVDLGASGLLSESAAPVLELEITNEQGENLGASMSRALLRGAVLDVYENGAWRRAPQARESMEIVNLAPGVPAQLGSVENASRGQRVVQRIILRNKTSPHLFALYRPVSIESSSFSAVAVGRGDFELASRARGLVEYTVVSQPRAPLPVPPLEANVDADFAQGPVRSLAERILQEAGVDLNASPPPTPRRVAKAIEERLQRDYTYTTTMTAPRAGQDPIEMFLFQTRSGHCEYFASAMAALCRSVGVRARVVTGYAASEFNAQTGRFIVRQSNAHAWVEALVDPEQGVWETFDPSPPDQLAVVHEPPRGLLGQLRRMLDEAEYWWITHVVAYRGRERDGAAVGDAALAKLERGLASLDRVGALLRSRAAPRALATAAAWGLGVFALVAGGGMAVRRLRGRAPRAPRLGRGAAAPLWRPLPRTRAQRRLERALKRAGLGRPTWRPPLAHTRLLEQEMDEPLARTLRAHCQALYVARFGADRHRRGRALRQADRLAEEARRLLTRRSFAGSKAPLRPRTAA